MFIVLSNSNPDPLYKQVSDQIKNAISIGELKPDEHLPSIRSMAKELSISVITIKRAYSDLENEGFIVTRPGLGSFVAEINKEKLREENLNNIKEQLKEIINNAKNFDISIDDIKNILEKWEGK